MRRNCILLELQASAGTSHGSCAFLVPVSCALGCAFTELTQHALPLRDGLRGLGPEPRVLLAREVALHHQLILAAIELDRPAARRDAAGSAR